MCVTFGMACPSLPAKSCHDMSDVPEKRYSRDYNYPSTLLIVLIEQVYNCTAL